MDPIIFLPNIARMTITGMIVIVVAAINPAQSGAVDGDWARKLEVQR